MKHDAPKRRNLGILRGGPVPNPRPQGVVGVVGGGRSGQQVAQGPADLQVKNVAPK